MAANTYYFKLSKGEMRASPFIHKSPVVTAAAPSTMLDCKRGFASATTFGSSEALNSGILSLSKKSRPAFLEGIAFYDIVVGPRNQSVERRSTELVWTLKPRPGKGRIHATLSKSLGGESRYG